MAASQDNPDIFAVTFSIPCEARSKRCPASSTGPNQKIRTLSGSSWIISAPVFFSSLTVCVPPIPIRATCSVVCFVARCAFADLLGIAPQSLSLCVEAVASQYSEAYPLLPQKAEAIALVLSGEEAKFRETLCAG